MKIKRENMGTAIRGEHDKVMEKERATKLGRKESDKEGGGSF